MCRRVHSIVVPRDNDKEKRKRTHTHTHKLRKRWNKIHSHQITREKKNPEYSALSCIIILARKTHTVLLKTGKTGCREHDDAKREYTRVQSSL